MASGEQTIAFGHLTIKGKARHAMEDYYVAEVKKVKEHELGLFAIYDGHLGHDVANYLQQNLFNNILKETDFFNDPKLAIQNAYKLTDDDILTKATNLGPGGGTTRSVLLTEAFDKYVRRLESEEPMERSYSEAHMEYWRHPSEVTAGSSSVRNLELRPQQQALKLGEMMTEDETNDAPALHEIPRMQGDFRFQPFTTMQGTKVGAAAVKDAHHPCVDAGDVSPRSVYGSNRYQAGLYERTPGGPGALKDMHGTCMRVILTVATLCFASALQVQAVGATHGSLQAGSSTGISWYAVLGVITGILGVIGIFISIVKRIVECMHQRRLRERIETERSRVAGLNFDYELQLALQRLEDDVETASASSALQQTAGNCGRRGGNCKYAWCHAIVPHVAAPVQFAGHCEGHCEGDT